MKGEQNSQFRAFPSAKQMVVLRLADGKVRPMFATILSASKYYSSKIFIIFLFIL